MGQVRIYVEKIQQLLKTEPNPAVILKTLCSELGHSTDPLAKEIASLSPPHLNMIHIVNKINGSKTDYNKEGKFAALLCAFLIFYRHYELQFTPEVLKQLPSRSEDAWLSQYAITPSSLTVEDKKTNISLLAKIDFNQPIDEKARNGYIEALLKNIQEFLQENTDPLDNDTFICIVNGLKKAYFILPIEAESVLESIILPFCEQPNWDRFCILFELRHFALKKLCEKIEKALDKAILAYSRTFQPNAEQLKWLCLFQCTKDGLLLKHVPLLGKDSLSEFLSIAKTADSFDLFACLARVKTPLSVDYQTRIIIQAGKDFINDSSSQLKLLTLAATLHPSVAKMLVKIVFNSPKQDFCADLDVHPTSFTEKSEQKYEFVPTKTIDSILDDAEIFQFLVRLILMINLSATDRLEAAHSLKELAQQKKYNAPKYDISFFLFSVLSAPFKTEQELWMEIEAFLCNKDTGLASPSAKKETDKTSICITLLNFFSSVLFEPAFQKKQIASLESMYDKYRDKPIVQLGILTLLSHFGFDQLQERLKLTEVISMLHKETSCYPEDLIAPLLIRLQTQIPADPHNDLSTLPVVKDPQNLLYGSTAGLQLLSCFPLQKQTAYMQPLFTSESMSQAFVSFIVDHSLDEQLFLSHTLLSDKKTHLLDIRAHHAFLHNISLLLRTPLKDKNIVWLILSYLPLEKKQEQDDLDVTTITRYLRKKEKKISNEGTRMSQSTQAMFRYPSLSSPGEQPLVGMVRAHPTVNL